MTKKELPYMKRYGVELLSVDGYGAKFIEQRALGFVASLVLAALFGEPWLALLGGVFVVFGWLAELWPENGLLLSAVIPLTALLWCLMAAVAFELFLPGSLLFGVIALALVGDGFRHPVFQKPL
ncbi:hypothetical protein [Teredinibacter franksiae]|uniref:hypothetical protein n=1 Tax=Teredinibacter franksiae TaxID=2761453 RepID=UPI0016283AAE|nr:hypothetical protein [Teredinibacter franksiae]